MIQEQKQLLLKDLSARLPYGVKMWFPTAFAPIMLDEFILNVARKRDENFKPYLRPMSSMTEKEKMAFDKFICIDEDAWLGKENGCVNQAKIMSDGVDWLNEHHFDYRGLIGKGLALEAPEGMYKTKLI